MIDEQLFQDYIANRAELKKPMTPTAVKRLRSKLLRLEAEGHCPNKLLDRSIINGWQDVWPDQSTLIYADSGQRSSFVETHTDRSWANGMGNVHKIR